VIRGERLIKLKNSWFSAKSILVERFVSNDWGKANFFGNLKIQIII